MSKVAIQGNASGTGTFSIVAPNSNTDRTLTLPDEAGTVLTSASTLSSSNLSGALPAIDGSALTGIGGGITEADQWRLTTTLTRTSGQFLTSNWERVDTNFDKIGTGVSESSGVFTFPTTGIWLVISQTTGGTANSSTFAGHRHFISTNSGASFFTSASQWASTHQTNAYHQATLLAMYDITDASAFQLKLECSTNGTSIGFDGSTTQTVTGITFLRLGDT